MKRSETRRRLVGLGSVGVRFCVLAAVATALAGCGETRELHDKTEFPLGGLRPSTIGDEYINDHLCETGAVTADLERDGGPLVSTARMAQVRAHGSHILYRVVLAAGAGLRVETTGDSAMDTVVALYDGDVLLDWNDDGPTPSLSRLEATVPRSSSYFVVVTAWPGYAGAVGVRILVDGVQGCSGQAPCAGDACVVADDGWEADAPPGDPGPGDATLTDEILVDPAADPVADPGPGCDGLEPCFLAEGHCYAGLLRIGAARTCCSDGIPIEFACAPELWSTADDARSRVLAASGPASRQPAAEAADLSCSGSDECADDNPCNADYCDDGTCRHSAYNIVPGCCFAPSLRPVDGLPWTDAERQAFADAQCDDRNGCTVDSCDQPSNRCVATPSDDRCCRIDSDCPLPAPGMTVVCAGGECLYRVTSEDACGTDADCASPDPCIQGTCFLGKCRRVAVQDCCDADAWCGRWMADGNSCTAERCLTVDGWRRCVREAPPGCVPVLPWREDFAEGTLAERGFSADEGVLPAVDGLWQVGPTESPADRRLVLGTSPRAGTIRQMILGPAVDWDPEATGSLGVQLRVRYRQQGGSETTLGVVARAATGSDVTLSSWVQDGPMDETLLTLAVPAAALTDGALRIGVRVEGPAAWRALEVDDIRLIRGRPSMSAKAVLMRCPDGTPACSLDDMPTRVGDLPGDGDRLSVEVPPSGGWLVLLCREDAGAWSDAWPLAGPPSIAIAPAPWALPAGLTVPAPGCEIDASRVGELCGTVVEPAFACAFNLVPDATPGAWTFDVAIEDAGTGVGGVYAAGRTRVNLVVSE